MNEVTEEIASPRLYLDTNVFVYAFEGAPAEAQHLLTLFEQLQRHERRAVTSELTLAELFAPTQNTRPDMGSIYENLLMQMTFIELLPITRALLIDTIDLRRQTRLKLLDAIHIATARSARCCYFISADKAMRYASEDMLWISPDVKGVATVLDSLRA